MTVVVSLLRGVNVGGRNRMKMDTLRGVYESLGLQNPQTYLQSGNVVFATRARDLIGLAARIEDGIEKTFGFRPSVILRTTSEMRDAVANNPFAAEPGLEPSKMLVTFLQHKPDLQVREKIRSMATDSERLDVVGRELYIYFPNGMRFSKLSMASFDKASRMAGTGRNWNTVRKLLEIAEAMERQ